MKKIINILKQVGIIVVMLIAVICLRCIIRRLMKKESYKEKYDTRIEQNEVEYTENLDEKIDEVKKEKPIDFNKDKGKKKGWWNDVINCQNTGDMSMYCKPKDKWIFPY
jgi:flagellar biosynthesis/type III secretory pathway M-ring protein FliF/YscJ